MAPDYFVLVVVAAAGVYQIAAIPAGLRGLWFFRRPRVQFLFGAFAIAGAFAWFYTKEERNVQHTIEGAQQLVLFLAAAIVAYLGTAFLASIINARMSSAGDDTLGRKPSGLGIEALKHATLFRAVRGRLRKSRRSED